MKEGRLCFCIKYKLLISFVEMQAFHDSLLTTHLF